MSLQFIYIYYFFAASVIASIPFLYLSNRSELLKLYRFVILCFVVFVYLYGMSRTGGADMVNYLKTYDNSDTFKIFDPGYMLINNTFKSLGLPFNALLIFSGFISLFAAHRISMFFNIRFVLLISILFLHIFIVRDFAQFRVGMAISFALIALTSSRKTKLLLYFVGISIHFTALFFVIAYEASLWAARLSRQRKRKLFLGLCFAVIFAIGLNVSYLSFIDPRIDLYLNWDRDGYGRTVNSYSVLVFNILILILALLSKKYWPPRMRELVYLQMFGIVTFFAFSGASIFAFRLANVTFSLYPVLLLMTLDSLRPYVPSGRLAMGFLLSMFTFLLLMRPGSMRLIELIVH